METAPGVEDIGADDDVGTFQNEWYPDVLQVERLIRYLDEFYSTSTCVRGSFSYLVDGIVMIQEDVKDVRKLDIC